MNAAYGPDGTVAGGVSGGPGAVGGVAGGGTGAVGGGPGGAGLVPGAGGPGGLGTGALKPGKSELFACFCLYNCSVFLLDLHTHIKMASYLHTSFIGYGAGGVGVLPGGGMPTKTIITV